ncbi:MAG: argininosuccinate lyase [Phycisphaerales bacterium]
MTALWAGRFQGEADPLFREFNDSLPFDRLLVQEDIRGSHAWAAALARAGVLTEAELTRLGAALDEVSALAEREPDSLVDAPDEDVHSWVERQLVARVGDLGKKLHTGRSRNDQVATDLRLWTLAQLTARQLEIDACIASLVSLAERERETVLPGFTHLQRAQPVLFSHWCLAYVEMLRRDAQRFSDAAGRTSQCPLGSGALAGTAYPVDRRKLAHELGFTAPTANSLDAVSDRDFVVESLSACALAAMHLSRLAEDLVFYSSSEAGFVEMSDAVTSGSSLMPQKKNPDACELLRGKTGRIVGSLVSILTVLKGLPLAYNKDLQEDKEPLFDAMRHLSRSLRMVPRILDGLTVNRERTREAAQGGYQNATELADYLVSKGVPFRDAHHQVGRLVRRAIEGGRPLEALAVDELAELAPRVERDVYVNLTVDAALRKRAVDGGTAPERVAESIRRTKAALGKRRGRGARSAGSNAGSAATAPAGSTTDAATPAAKSARAAVAAAETAAAPGADAGAWDAAAGAAATASVAAETGAGPAWSSPRGPLEGVVAVRGATVEDFEAICGLVDLWAKRGENLPRSPDEILEKIPDFGVATVDGRVAGCASLWIYTPQLAEIRSLGLDERIQGFGLGSKLVEYFLDKARDLGIPKVFVLTRAPRFFEKCGFRQVSVNSLPEKILKDCARCPKNTCCDEIAMVHDVLP